MKKTFGLAIASIFILSFLAFADSEGYYSGSYSRLSYVKGDVFIQRAEDLGYEKGEVNLAVIEGDKLGTKEGRAEIQFGRRNYLRLDNFTQIDFVNLPQEDGEETKLHLLSGCIYLRINFLGKEKGFSIHTPDASFYILDEGLYRVDVRENKETEFAVIDGEAEVAGEEGSHLLKDQERLLASNGKFKSELGSFSAYHDDFSEWNASRDALYAQRVTRSYLPSELDEYEAELASNGRWVYEYPYGYVWIPHLTYYNWQPYYYGRWVWYPFIGWTWVSYDPWGWCCFHYGRWGWRFGLGWYWIPMRFWGPAWVHWYWGYDYIGWCPLNYYGYPAIIINNYFYNRYTYNYFPTNSKTLIVVHKNQLQSRRISQMALGKETIRGFERITLRAEQPPVRPNIERSGELVEKAERALSRRGLRDVGQGFGSGQRFPRTHAEASSRERAIQERRTAGSERVILPRNEDSISRPSSQDRARTINNRTIEKWRDSSTSQQDKESRSFIRTFPSRQDSSSVRPSKSDEGTSTRMKKNEGDRKIEERSFSSRSNASPREFEPRSSSREWKEYLPKNSDPSSSRSSSRRYIQESAPSFEERSSSPTIRSNQREKSSSIKDFFSQFESRSSRSYESPRYSSPRNNSSSFSRSFSAPSRSFSAPSRSSSSSSGSFSRSSPSFSRSLPSRSSSGSSSSRSSGSRTRKDR